MAGGSLLRASAGTYSRSSESNSNASRMGLTSGNAPTTLDTSCGLLDGAEDGIASNYASLSSAMSRPKHLVQQDCTSRYPGCKRQSASHSTPLSSA